MSRVECTDDITCPWCDYELTDSWQYNNSGSMECPECGKDFSYEASIEITYNSWTPPILGKRNPEALPNGESPKLAGEPDAKPINGGK